MATAYIDWSDENCDWGTTPLNDVEYSCANSSDGLHTWTSEAPEFVTYCVECGREREESSAKLD